MLRRGSLALALVAVVAVAAFFAGRHTDSTSAPRKNSALVGAVNVKGQKVKLRTERPAPGQSRIRLKVITAKGRNTLALVPVYINGKGPLAFAVDTGASSTVIDERVARKVGLRPGRSLGTMQGVAGSAEGRAIRVGRWRADKIGLPPSQVASLKGLAGRDGKGPEGLLGSDVLSRYGRVAVDYDNDMLLLDPRVVPARGK